MRFAEVLNVFARAGAVDESEDARIDLADRGLDARRIAVLDFVRVLPYVGDLPPEAAAWRAAGRGYVVRIYDRLTACVGLRAFPSAESAPACIFADAGGLSALRAPGGTRADLDVADGLPNFLRAALSPTSSGRTLGVVSPSDWMPDLAERVASRCARINVVGSSAFAESVRTRDGSARDGREGAAS